MAQRTDQSVQLMLLRHGVTSWNAAGRIQGRVDTALSIAGRALLRGRCLPDTFDAARWIASPLLRARQSALLLGAKNLEIDVRLQEMDWGQWEGERLSDLRLRLGQKMHDNEAKGLDFRPRGGESPRDVAKRVQDWLTTLLACNEAGRPVAAVTHKGVIRAALSLATGWDMRTDFSPRLDWRAGHCFELSNQGLSVVRLNVALSRHETVRE